MTTSTSDFSIHELRSLAVVMMAIDKIAPDFREEALAVIDRLANLDEASQVAFAEAVEVLARAERTEELITYLRSGRPLLEEILGVIDQAEEDT